MDKVHKPDTKDFISELVNVREFYEKWMSNYPYQGINPKFPGSALEFLESKLQVDDETMQSLKDECSVNSLDCDGEQLDYTYSTIRRRGLNLNALPNVDLATIHLKRQELCRHTSQESFKSYLATTQNNFTATAKLELENKPDEIPKSQLIMGPEVILKVSVYLPWKRNEQNLLDTNLTVSQEFLVLGRQKLTELRDKIECVSDHIKFGECSDNTDKLDAEKNAKETYRSNFLYINGTFYNDMRYPECVDTSNAIINWSNDPKREVGTFERANMEETTFLDLSLKLGYPYVYQHQGSCEHLVVFTDLRLLGMRDSRDESQYPKLTGIHRSCRLFCMACYKYTAKWLTTRDETLPYDPFFYCDTCLRLFKYTDNGKKIGEFVLHQYVDRSAII